MTARDDSTDRNHPEVPDDPQHNPESAVDALEDRVFGEPVDQVRGRQDDTSPAFEQDLEPEDQGSAGAGDEQPE